MVLLKNGIDNGNYYIIVAYVLGIYYIDEYWIRISYTQVTQNQMKNKLETS